MRKATNKTANHAINQSCYISIHDPDNAKLRLGQGVIATGKTAAGAYDASYDGLIVSVNGDHKKGVARLKCNNTTVRLAEDERFLDDVPDGTLTVTVTGGPTIDPIDVVYTADTP